MIKVCYIIGQLSRDGAERQLYELVKGINKKIFTPTVISLSQGGYWADKIREINIEVTEIPRKSGKEFTRLFKLIKELKRIKPDIVNTYMFSANSYGRIAAVLTGVPVIIASERNAGEIGKDKDRSELFIDKFLTLFSHGIICNSYRCSEVLIKQYSYKPGKVFTVQNGIDMSSYMNGNNLRNSSEKVVGTVGRLYPQKNHKLFMDMAKKVLDARNDKDINFMIIGDGPLRTELEDYARRLKVEDNVIFTGSRGDIPELLAGMDVFVITSYYEGLSNAIMEAMASALPVVATDVGGSSELVIDGKTGYLCPSNDSGTIADRVMGLLDDGTEARRTGEAGRNKIMNEFGMDRMVRSTEDIYKKFIEMKGLK
jgi:glycosyltransferase involved in cell wall biosynthesis